MGALSLYWPLACKERVLKLVCRLVSRLCDTCFFGGPINGFSFVISSAFLVVFCSAFLVVISSAFLVRGALDPLLGLEVVPVHVSSTNGVFWFRVHPIEQALHVSFVRCVFG